MNGRRNVGPSVEGLKVSRCMHTPLPVGRPARIVWSCLTSMDGILIGLKSPGSSEIFFFGRKTVEADRWLIGVDSHHIIRQRTRIRIRSGTARSWREEILSGPDAVANFSRAFRTSSRVIGAHIGSRSYILYVDVPRIVTWFFKDLTSVRFHDFAIRHA